LNGVIVHSLREHDRKRLFDFSRELPSQDLWGKKGYYLKGDFERFEKFFDYIETFQPKCFLIAEKDQKIQGFVVAVYNPQWVDILKERYRHPVEKRTYILGIAVAQRRLDILKSLIDEMIRYLSQKGIRSAEYPTLGDVCLTTGSGVLTPDNVDALLWFREAGFKVNECYYFMKLDLSKYLPSEVKTNANVTFRFKERRIEVTKGDEVLGRILWSPVEEGAPDIDIYVEHKNRGKGLGTMLMNETLKELKKQGAEAVEVGVDGNNVPALKLYHKFGFEVEHTYLYIIVKC